MNVDLWRGGLRGALQLHPLARLLAHTLATYAGADGQIAADDQPSIEELCTATGMEAGQVLQGAEDLAVTGWVERHNTNGPTEYQLRLPARIAEIR